MRIARATFSSCCFKMQRPSSKNSVKKRVENCTWSPDESGGIAQIRVWWDQNPFKQFDEPWKIPRSFFGKKTQWIKSIQSILMFSRNWKKTSQIPCQPLQQQQQRLQPWKNQTHCTYPPWNQQLKRQNRCYPKRKRKLVFQASIFRGKLAVSFKEANCWKLKSWRFVKDDVFFSVGLYSTKSFLGGGKKNILHNGISHKSGISEVLTCCAAWSCLWDDMVDSLMICHAGLSRVQLDGIYLTKLLRKRAQRVGSEVSLGWTFFRKSWEVSEVEASHEHGGFHD